MAQKRRGRLSVTHRFGEDNADGTKEVIALTLIHIVRSKAFLLAMLAIVAGFGLIPIESFKNIVHDQTLFWKDNPRLPATSTELESE